MAKGKDLERLPRPEPESPIANISDGKILVKVSGRLKYTSDNQRVQIERNE